VARSPRTTNERSINFSLTKSKQGSARNRDGTGDRAGSRKKKPTV
jgi:hypothetical protein